MAVENVFLRNHLGALIVTGKKIWRMKPETGFVHIVERKMALKGTLVGIVIQDDYVNSLEIGFSIGIFLIIWLSIEIATLFFVNRKFALSPYEKEERNNIKEESKDYASRALNLAGLTFAAIALWVGAFSSNLEEIEATIAVSMFALFLFLFSYKMYALTGLRRIYWILQDKTLNLGLIAIVLALVTFSFEKLSWFSIPALLFFAVIAFLQLIEYKNDLDCFWQRRKSLEK
jgi:hypothetical protein